MVNQKPHLRNPPAYQEYTSNRLANRDFKQMTLAEKGLYWCMLLECWENGSVPENAKELSKILNLDINEVEENLNFRITKYFELIEGSTDLICPELEKQRENYKWRREAQSRGGKKGGERTQQANRDGKAMLEGKLKPMSRVENHSVKIIRSGLPTGEQLDHDAKDWVDGYQEQERKSLIGKFSK
jgi:uncharacterized protein YdaU (DUF1376 family)